MVMKTPKCWMCGQKLTTNWVPSVVDYHTGCYRVGCRHCGWATYLTSATEEQAIDSAKEFMAKIPPTSGAGRVFGICRGQVLHHSDQKGTPLMPVIWHTQR